MWVILAFLALGFLVGQLVGLSATSVTTSILGFLFAFGGGSAVGFLKGLEPADRTMAAQAIFALSVSCMAGIYVGIYVSEQQLLTTDKAVAAKRTTSADRKYLRQNVVAAAHSIDQQLANKQLTRKQAYDELQKIARETGDKARAIEERVARKELKLEQAYADLYELLTADEKAQ